MQGYFFTSCKISSTQSKNYKHVQGNIKATPKATLAPSSSKEPTSHFVTFTPRSDHFDADTFPKWCKRIGNEYLCLNWLKIEDQKKIANFNGLSFDDSFWLHEAHEVFWDLLVAVHKKEPLDGWNAETREGMHRRTGSFISFYVLSSILSSVSTQSLRTISSMLGLERLSQINQMKSSIVLFTATPITAAMMQNLYSYLHVRLSTL